jgi:uncharacterized protein involved in exopolysaccharide biosynthesis
VVDRQHRDFTDVEIDPRVYAAIFRKAWWKIVLFSLAAGLATLLVMLRFPKIYQATAVIAPVTEEKKQIPALGALASFGVEVGGPSRVEDLETLFKSNDLTVRVFRKYDLWPVVLGERYDPATRKVKASWSERLFRSGSPPRDPGYWDAVRAAKDALKISVDRKAGTLSISFLTGSPDRSPKIVEYYLEEAKNRLQEEALDRSSKNKKFLAAQLGRTVDTLTKDRLYSLFGQEVEREMLAHNREQFGFKIIDAPQVPDRKSKPRAGSGAMLAFVLAFFAGSVYFIGRGTGR